MPPKASVTAHLTLHPRDGVTPETVGKVKEWVGAQLKDNVIWSMAVTELNKDGLGRHLHVAIGFKNPVYVSSDYKRRVLTLLREELSDPTVWGKNSVDCRAHNDPGGLVSGYHKKTTEYEVCWEMGEIPSEEEQAEGAARRDAALARIKILKATERDIPKLFKLMDQYHKQADEILDEMPNLYKDGDEEYYRDLNDEQQVEKCYRQLITEGYYHLMMKISPGKLKHFTKYWKDLISAPEV